MDIRLADFLQAHEVDKNEPFTHTSKIRPLRRYNIPETDIEEFYAIYNQIVNDGGTLGITEKPQDIVPLIIDIDFRCSLDQGIKRYYKPKHIRDIVTIYQEIIAEICVDPKDEYFYCCVLEKTSPSVYQGRCKDGFHLHFPHFFTEPWVQKEYIRTKVIQLVQERKILADIPILEPIDKVFDKNIPAVCWLMYGSRKDIKAEAYKVTKRYNKDLELLQIKDVFKNKYPTGTRAWNMPRYLSIRQGVGPTPLKQDAVCRKPVLKKSRKKEYQRELDVILSELIVSEQLLEMLNDDRADDYALWMEIGWILYNISEGHQKGLDLWITFSGRSEKFQDGVCEKEWEKMEVKEYTLATLKYLAKNDSPNEYSSWKDNIINHTLQQGINMAHNDIARILFILYENEMKCIDIEKEEWVVFKGHRWQKSKKGVDLRWHISHELVNQYSRLICHYSTRAQEEEDQEQKQMYNSKSLMISKLIDKLKNNSFKNCIMKEAMEYFHDKDFITKMDENPNLLVCENGVYDAEAKIFRDGRPDDYCTKSTNLYYHDFEEDDERIVELNEIFKKTFVNPKLFTFFKQTVSDLIRGGNRHKIFVIWTGVGDNGKSICADLLENALGDYYYTPPTTMLTGKQQQSSGATSELMPCKGARAVVVSETDNADVLNCGTMKKLTGGDPFYVRGNFKEAAKVTPQFKLILHCNKMPNISAEDKASWNRIRVLPYESTFVNKNMAPESEEEQWSKKMFPKDKTLKDRLKDLAEPFLWWLIKEYEKFGDSDLYEPPAVKSATDAYHKTNDFYMQFIDERIKETGDKKDFITLTVIYALFKIWFKDSFPGAKIPSRQNVKEAIEKKLGKQVKGVWRGVVTFDPDEDIDEEAENGSLQFKKGDPEESEPEHSKRLSKVIE